MDMAAKKSRNRAKEVAMYARGKLVEYRVVMCIMRMRVAREERRRRVRMEIIIQVAMLMGRFGVEERKVEVSMSISWEFRGGIVSVFPLVGSCSVALVVNLDRGRV